MSDIDLTPFRSIGDVAKSIVANLALGTVERHPVRDRASWLEMRSQDLTASDVSSICGVGYKSPLQVWAEKKKLVPPTADSPILKRGRIFEPAIWAAIAEERPDWQLRAAKVYLRSPSMRFGATPDALAIEPGRSELILIQGKVVAKPIFIADWLGGERDGTEPQVPLGYQLQTLAETILAEAAFEGQVIRPILAALVIGGSFEAPQLYLIPVQRHADAERKIIDTVQNFWSDFHAGIQPALDPGRDHDVVKKLYPAADGDIIDLTSDNALPGLIDEKKSLGEEIARQEKRRKAITTEIMFKMGNNVFALIAGGRKLSCKVTEVAGGFRDGYSFRQIREVKVK